ncbi:hypothetical protein BRC89_11910 [Halobacteriales archaeon QS_4_70_19]|nr:MAG: hypothetical protein BRC89_11910 [Halobacteriales archaeon QS_4_70_19]
MRRTRRGALAAPGTAAVGGLVGLGGTDGAVRAAAGTWPQPGGDAANDAAERAHWTCPERYVRVGGAEATGPTTTAPDD